MCDGIKMTDLSKKILEISLEFTSLANTPEKAVKYFESAFHQLTPPSYTKQKPVKGVKTPKMNEFYKKV